MPRLNGLFDYIAKLEDVSVSDVQKWLPAREDEVILQNKIGNRILYPGVVSLTKKDLIFELAIIRKVIEVNQNKLYNKNLKRIDIPDDFLEYFPDLQNLVGAFIDAIHPLGITSFWLKSEILGKKNLGTLIHPEQLQAGGLITIGIHDKQYQIKIGSLVIIPILQSRIDLTFTSDSARLMGKKIISTEVVTGQLGLIIDTRI